MKNSHRPIVRVKRGRTKKHKVSHGTWKIAYADFMTAMMAFFLVMWLLSISDAKQLTQIADYFRTPLKAAVTGGKLSSDSESPFPGGGDPTRRDGEIKKSSQHEFVKGHQDEIRLNHLRKKLDKLIDTNPHLRVVRQNLIINMTENGLRIQIVDSQKRPMFKIGSAQIEPDLRDMLRAIAPILNDIPNRISLAGHTDDFQYANRERSYSNWELSTDRANASRRELVAGGLDSRKMLSVVGMANTMQLKNHTGNDPVNRRISLLVLNQHAQVLIEKEYTGEQNQQHQTE